MLCQIEKCCQYADRFGRTVIVDTNFRSSESFHDKFSKYFVSLQSGLVLDADEISDKIDKVDVFPDFITGKVSSYYVRYDTGIENFVEEASGGALTFDFGKNYSERLLGHHAAGGGTKSLAALHRMRVHDAITDVLWERQRLIGPEYTGLHIRNTDFQTEYAASLEELRSKICGPLFVATDDRNAIEHCQTLFGEERVFSFAKLPDDSDKPLHYVHYPAGTYEANSDAILDLLMLALSKQLYLFRLMPNRHRATYSGFSVLAVNLKASAPLLRQLLSKPQRYPSGSPGRVVTLYSGRGPAEQGTKESRSATMWTRFASRVARFTSKAVGRTIAALGR